MESGSRAAPTSRSSFVHSSKSGVTNAGSLIPMCVCTSDIRKWSEASLCTPLYERGAGGILVKVLKIPLNPPLSKGDFGSQILPKSSAPDTACYSFNRTLVLAVLKNNSGLISGEENLAWRATGPRTEYSFENYLSLVSILRLDYPLCSISTSALPTVKMCSTRFSRMTGISGAS
jgi:hypothetical protein